MCSWLNITRSLVSITWNFKLLDEQLKFEGYCLSYFILWTIFFLQFVGHSYINQRKRFSSRNWMDEDCNLPRRRSYWHLSTLFVIWYYNRLILKLFVNLRFIISVCAHCQFQLLTFYWFNKNFICFRDSNLW